VGRWPLDFLDIQFLGIRLGKGVRGGDPGGKQKGGGAFCYCRCARYMAWE